VPDATEQLQPLGESFSDRAHQDLTGHLGMWAWLASEVMLFGGLFLGYAIARVTYPEGFAEGSRELDVFLGGLNTYVLLGSSLAMALAEHAAKAGRRRPLLINLGAVLLLGGLFLAIKFYEYYDKALKGHVPGADFEFSGEHPQAVELFLFLYFTMTGLHALHMLGGLSVIGGTFLRTAVTGRMPGPLFVTATALYWHFVDIVWVFLFPCLYLVR